LGRMTEPHAEEDPGLHFRKTALLRPLTTLPVPVESPLPVSRLLADVGDFGEALHFAASVARLLPGG